MIQHTGPMILRDRISVLCPRYEAVYRHFLGSLKGLKAVGDMALKRLKRCKWVRLSTAHPLLRYKVNVSKASSIQG